MTAEVAGRSLVFVTYCSPGGAFGHLYFLLCGTEVLREALTRGDSGWYSGGAWGWFTQV